MLGHDIQSHERHALDVNVMAEEMLSNEHYDSENVREKQVSSIIFCSTQETSWENSKLQKSMVLSRDIIKIECDMLQTVSLLSEEARSECVWDWAFSGEFKGKLFDLQLTNAI